MHSNSRSWRWVLTLCATAGIATQAHAQTGAPCWSDAECGAGSYCEPTWSDGGSGGGGTTGFSNTGGEAGTGSTGWVGSTTGGDSSTGGNTGSDSSTSGGTGWEGSTGSDPGTNGGTGWDGSTGSDPGTNGGGEDHTSGSGGWSTTGGVGDDATNGGSADPFPGSTGGSEPPVGECVVVADYWCERDEDCTGDNYCDVDCDDGALCEPRPARFGGCAVPVPAPEGGCGDGGDFCPAGFACVAPAVGGSCDDKGCTTEFGSPVCTAEPQPCGDNTECDDGYECVSREGSGTGGIDDDGTPIDLPVPKQCEVKRAACDSDADCAEEWTCVALTNTAGGLASPARWGEVGAIKNCYPDAVASYAETIAGLPTAPRKDAQYPGETGGVDSSTNGEIDGATNGATGGGSSTGGNGSGGGNTGGASGGASSGGSSSTGSNSSASSGGASQGPVERSSDCSVGGGLGGVGGAWLMLALSSLVGRRKRHS